MLFLLGATSIPLPDGGKSKLARSSGTLDQEAETVWKTGGSVLFSRLLGREAAEGAAEGAGLTPQSPGQPGATSRGPLPTHSSCLVPATCFAHSDLQSACACWLIHYRWDDRS